MDLSSNPYYLSHLTRLNETNEVQTSEDIVNQQGALIASKGTNVTPALAKQIAQHKLAKTLDDSIQLQHTYSPIQMMACLKDRLEEIGFSHLMETFKLEEDIRFHLDEICKYPQIQLKLSVLAETYFDTFRRSLVAAAVTLGLCQELKVDLRSSRVSNIFKAALMCDIGLLHIKPGIAQMEGTFSPEQFKAYQGHVAISKHFADMVPNLDKQVGQAIVEHHERSDGFGYPLQKKADGLSIEGRIVAQVDTIIAIYRKRILGEGYSFSTLIPVLQFCSGQNHPAVSQAAIRFVYKVSSKLEQSRPKYSAKDLSPKLIDIIERLNRWQSKVDALIEHYEKEMKAKAALPYIGLYNNLKLNLTTSGLIDETQLGWLKNLQNGSETTEPHTIEQFALMLYEIEYQCRHAHKQFSPAITDIFKLGPDAARVKEQYQKLDQLFQ